MLRGFARSPRLGEVAWHGDDAWVSGIHVELETVERLSNPFAGTVKSNAYGSLAARVGE